jgi:hypothetical protein
MPALLFMIAGIALLTDHPCIAFFAVAGMILVA